MKAAPSVSSRAGHVAVPRPCRGFSYKSSARAPPITASIHRAHAVTHEWQGEFCAVEPGHIRSGRGIKLDAGANTFCSFREDGRLLSGSTDLGVLKWSAHGSRRPDSWAPGATALCADSSGKYMVFESSSSSGVAQPPFLMCEDSGHSFPLAGLTEAATCYAITQLQPAVCLVLAGTGSGAVYAWTADVSAADGTALLPASWPNTTGAAIRCCSVSAEAQLAASGGEDQFLRLWSLASGQQVLAVQCQAAVTCCTFSADGSKVAVGMSDGHVAVHEVEQLRAAWQVSGYAMQLVGPWIRHFVAMPT